MMDGSGLGCTDGFASLPTRKATQCQAGTCPPSTAHTRPVPRHHGRDESRLHELLHPPHRANLTRSQDLDRESAPSPRSLRIPCAGEVGDGVTVTPLSMQIKRPVPAGCRTPFPPGPTRLRALPPVPVPGFRQVRGAGQPMRTNALALTHSGVGRLQVCWQSIVQ